MPIEVDFLRVACALPQASAWARYALEFVSFLGSGWMLWALMPVFAVPSLRKHRQRATALLGVVLTTAAVVCILKLCIGRLRPCHALAWVQTEGVRLPNDFSFPSGHAAGAFAVAAFAFAISRGLGAALFLIATLIAFSRVALGVHYPTDVAAGALLGGAIGLSWGRHAQRHANA